MKFLVSGRVGPLTPLILFTLSLFALFVVGEIYLGVSTRGATPVEVRKILELESSSPASLSAAFEEIHVHLFLDLILFLFLGSLHLRLREIHFIRNLFFLITSVTLLFFPLSILLLSRIPSGWVLYSLLFWIHYGVRILWIGRIALQLRFGLNHSYGGDRFD